MACTADPDVNAAVLRRGRRPAHLLPARRRRPHRLGVDAGHRPQRPGHRQRARRPRPAAGRRPARCRADGRGGAAARGAPAGGPGPTPAGTGGRVVLVGGGPGDPGLLTLRGLPGAGRGRRRRRRPAGAAGRAGRPARGRRDRRRLQDPARPVHPAGGDQRRCWSTAPAAGCVVVRLKGGDPFVFGRGMEEVLGLPGAGVPVTVVPGRHLGGRRPGAGRHPGHPPRPLAGLHRGLRARRAGRPAQHRRLGRARPRRHHARRADGRRDPARHRRGAAGRRPPRRHPARLRRWTAACRPSRSCRSTLAQVVSAGPPPGLRSPAVIVIGRGRRLRRRLSRRWLQ